MSGMEVVGVIVGGVVGTAINACYDGCRRLYRRLEASERTAANLAELERAIQTAHYNIMRSELALAETPSGQFCLQKFQELLVEVNAMLTKLSTSKGKRKYVCSKKTRILCDNLKQRCELITQGVSGLRNMWDAEHPGRSDEFLTPPAHAVADAAGASAGSGSSSGSSRAEGALAATGEEPDHSAIPAVAPPVGALPFGARDPAAAAAAGSAHSPVAGAGCSTDGGAAAAGAGATGSPRSSAAPSRGPSYGQLERMLSDALRETPRLWNSEAEGGSAAVASATLEMEDWLTQLSAQPDDDAATVDDVLRSFKALEGLAAPLLSTVEFDEAAGAEDDAWDFAYVAAAESCDDEPAAAAAAAKEAGGTL